MATGGYILALFLPWILGISWLTRFTRGMNMAALLGYGYLAGILLTTLFMRAWGLAGMPLDYWVMAVVLVLLTLAPLAVPPGKAVRNTPASHPVTGDPDGVLNWQTLLFTAVVAFLAYRFAILIYDSLLRPVFPWDAWRSYAPIAKVWFEVGELIPFASAQEWNASDPADAVYPAMLSQKKPFTVPLIMLWSALGIDAWRDDLVKIPWVLCGVALALGVYGQFRHFGISRHVAILFVYLLVSQPYVNIHLSLGGYTEIWFATGLCFATLSYLRWHEDRRIQDLILALTFAASCALFKLPGFVFLAILATAIVVDSLPKKTLIAAAGAATAGMAVLLVSVFGSNPSESGWIKALQQGQFDLPLLGDEPIVFTDVSNIVVDTLLVSPNWHLFWYGAAILLVAGLMGGRALRPFPGPLFFAIATPAALLFPFYMTNKYVAQAEELTTLNRALLLIMPALFVFLVWWVFGRAKEANSGVKSETGVSAVQASGRQA